MREGEKPKKIKGKKTKKTKGKKPPKPSPMEYCWSREISRKNLIDEHFIVASDPQNLCPDRGKKLRKLIHAVVKNRINVLVEPIEDSREWTNYIFKAKIAGTRKGRISKSDDVDVIARAKDPVIHTDDYYAPKRVLFIPHSGLKKHGASKGFWRTSKAQLTAEYKADKAAKEKVRNTIENAAKSLEAITDKHFGHICKQLIAEIARDPKNPETKKQNKQLADAWLHEQREYQEELEIMRNWENRHDLFDDAIISASPQLE